MIKIVLLLLLASCGATNLRNVSLDIGAEFCEGAYVSAGVSYPVLGPIYIGSGIWKHAIDDIWGAYVSANISWEPFK